ncbi:MAG TPA: DUF4350 domain-containing protein [Candidatus Limnocylindria bacterium]|nr:DUF4350 domain-containing protein [Candidatus Limnocylindria bacterium]
MRRRFDPLYLATAALAIVTIVVLIVTTTSPTSESQRTASAYDDGPGGAGALRRYLGAMGMTTTTIQGASFAPVQSSRVILVLGASEPISDTDALTLRNYVRAGGTLVVATELGFLERPLFDAFGVRVSGFATPGTHPLSSAAFADPPARSLSVDRAVAVVPGAKGDVLATDGRAALIAAVREGSGLFIAVGSLWPFLGGGLGEEDNARVVLGLVRPALGGGTVAFDEYHHGLHPSSDVLVLLERTWPGRALVFVAIVTFLYLLLSGRRIGPAVPLQVRPARSSLEYIRGFAGLVRRSGRGEIARRRLREDLHGGLARSLGLDPATPFDRVLATLGASDRARAAQARAVDDALARPLRDDQLLRTVAQIDQLLARPT